MSAKTDYAETKCLDAMLRNTGFTPPANLYLALHTGDPGEAGSANEVGAVGGYVRKAITFTAGYLNTAEVSWTAAGAGLGTITHVSLWDASSGGNCWRKGAMAASKTIADGDTLRFGAGTIACTED